MPTDTSSVDGDELPAEDADDELTFAAHDLGRDRAPVQGARDLGFEIPKPAGERVTAADSDGFVIRQVESMAPAAPVDTLVVGAPEPAPAAEAPAPALPNAFRISSATAAPAVQPRANELWTTREPAREPAATPSASRRGWSTRHSELVDRSANATMLRLREEAVNVSWKAAWIAVTSANPRLLRKRSRASS